ncbi:hypothetical protein ILYODFUR_012826 [Ilyodon furcidens]|uniref:Uncharacterized protein n=1 Tax=Ilyodon furcidens TaxID=33524 RepID=A0ABV0SKQ8_9TELE
MVEVWLITPFLVQSYHGTAGARLTKGLTKRSRAQDSSAGGENTVPSLAAVSQKLPVILFTLVSCNRLFH